MSASNQDALAVFAAAVAGIGMVAVLLLILEALSSGPGAPDRKCAEAVVLQRLDGRDELSVTWREIPCAETPP